MAQMGQTAVQTSDASTASVTSTSIKMMFRAKPGFVIPKNKLAGSLVPTFRGAKKSKGSDAGNEHSNKETQRKTRWGEDLMQDASVRRAKALAYQTRVEQITRQLKAGSLRSEDDQDDILAENVADHGPSSRQTDNQEKLQQLELEKREIIGEILKLNPSFKAPSDYKPLMKEDCAPLPVKEHPGFNFVGLFFGPGGDTLKRLEKETGARVKVHGTKSETREKVEIKASDGSEAPSSYDEMHVQISADSYEKIDTAIALIELLVSSVSGKSVAPSKTTASGDDVTALSKASDSTSGGDLAMQSQVAGLATSVALPNPQSLFQPYGAPWMPPTSPATSLVPPVSNPGYPSPFPLNYSNMTSSPGPRLGPPISVPQTTPNVLSTPQPSMQGFQRPFLPGVHPLGQVVSPGLQNPAPHSSSFQPNNTTPAPFTGHQLSVGQPRPTVASPHLMGPQSTHLGSSTGWAVPPAGPSGMAQSTPPVPFSGPPASYQPMTPSTPQASAQFPSQFQSSSALPVQQFTPRGPLQNLSVHTPLTGMQNPVFAAVRSPSFSPLNSMTGVAPRPHQPSSGDFTFQPHRQPAMPPPGPGSHLSSHGSGTSLMPPPPSPGAPPFRQPFSNQMGHHPLASLGSFGGNHGNFGNPIIPQGRPPHVTNIGGPFPPRPGPGSSMQFQPGMRPGNVFAPNENFRSNVMFSAVGPSAAASPVGQQAYDPFSPTSVVTSP